MTEEQNEAFIPEEPVAATEQKTTRTSKKTTRQAPQKKGFNFFRNIFHVIGGKVLAEEGVLKYIPFLFFMAFLGLLYIANIYYAERTVSSIDSIKNELKELRYEHISTKSELMTISTQTEVSRRLEGTGLKPTLIPPAKLVIEKATQTENKSIASK